MLNSNVGSRKQIKQERNWVLGKGTGEGFYEKKMNRSQDSKEKECKALWLSGEMIAEVKDKINVKNLKKKKKKTCEAQQEAGVHGMDDSSLRIASFAFMTTGPLRDDMQPSN